MKQWITKQNLIDWFSNGGLGELVTLLFASFIVVCLVVIFFVFSGCAHHKSTPKYPSRIVGPISIPKLEQKRPAPKAKKRVKKPTIHIDGADTTG